MGTVDLTFELLIKDLCPTSLAAFGLDVQWESTLLSMLEWHCIAQQKHIFSSVSAPVKLSILYYLKVLGQLFFILILFGMLFIPCQYLSLHCVEAWDE